MLKLFDPTEDIQHCFSACVFMHPSLVLSIVPQTVVIDA